MGKAERRRRFPCINSNPDMKTMSRVLLWSAMALAPSSPSLAVAGKHGKRHAMHANKPQAVSDWLNLHSLGTMLLLALGYIEHLVSFNFLNLLPENH